MPKGPKDGDYEVGYRKPPKHTRFKKGQSGNPKGRPKGCQNTRIELENLLNQRIEVRGVDGKTKTLTVRKAVLQKIVHDALKGVRHAQEMLFKLTNRYVPGEADIPVPPEVDRDRQNAEIIREYTARIISDDLPDDFD